MSQTLAMMHELSATCKRVYIFIDNDGDPYVSIEAVLFAGKEYGNDTQKMDIKVRHSTIEEAVTDIHTKVMTFIGKAPEFDANKTIEHHPNDAWEA